MVRGQGLDLMDGDLGRRVLGVRVLCFVLNV